MPKFMDLTGKRFGRLTVIERAETKNGKTRWKCLCDCGKYTYTITNRLVQGKSLSCGCRAYEAPRITHGMKHTRLYEIWLGMKKRCDNKNSKSYERYGERGIKLCPEWENDFKAFAEWAFASGYSDDLTIDRIDNEKGYFPENCRWATWDEQAKNKRNSIFITHNGETKVLPDWCRELNFPYKTALQRYTNMVKQGKKVDFDALFYNGNRKERKIVQLSTDGGRIKIWACMSDISKAGFDRSNVSACCNGKKRLYRGFIWSYAGE